MSPHRSGSSSAVPVSELDELEAERPAVHATDLHALHAPIMREKDRPSDGMQPIPLTLIFAFGALLMWGGWYLGAYSGGWRLDVFDPSQLAPVSAPVEAPTRHAAGDDPMLLGRRVYAQCSACHQANGQGLAGVFPPLAGSRWVTEGEGALIRILLHGLNGPVEVRGEVYQGVMPAWSQLSDRQIGAVLTYIRRSWGNEAAPISAEAVAEIREAEAGRSSAWTAEALSGFR